MKAGMTSALVLGAVLTAVAAPAISQVPPDIASAIRAKGKVIDGSVRAMYAALLPQEPYAGVEIVRDLAYGPDPLQKLDVYRPAKAAADLRPVLLFVHGGGFTRGDKHDAGTPFPDNQLVWAVNSGMVGVSINYRLAPAHVWPSAAQDLASAIAWTRAHAREYGGDPDRIFLWGHSAGANHVADYVAHPELRGPEAAGVKGAILLSALYQPQMPAKPNVYYGVDADAQLYAPMLQRLKNAAIPIFIAGAGYDPEYFQVTLRSLKEDLCKAGRCPGYVFLPDHSHLSEGAAVGTDDTSLTRPMLAWIRAQK